MKCKRGRRTLLRTVGAVVFVFLFPTFLLAQQAASKYPPTIVFMTDFGVVDDSVAICRGVMYSIMPEVRIVDLTHQVTPFSILDGARFLYGATPYYPAGTVFVVVVDPTVGSTRKAIVAKSKKGQLFVLPDNGLLTLVEQRDGIESAREITNREWMIGAKLSSTFHGRDIFSPVGGHLAHGEEWTQVGPDLPVTNLVRLRLLPATLDEKELKAQVIAIDGPFGNLVTNVDSELFAKLGYKLGDRITFRLGEVEITAPFVKTFSDVAIGEPLFYIDSRGNLGFSVDQAYASTKYNIKPPVSLVIPRKGN
jgi:S-adenosylmethionine hydrolase